jgi:hypothetical protein
LSFKALQIGTNHQRDSNEFHPSNLSRKDEVLNGFNFNKTVEDFVIIDGDKSLNVLPPFLKDHLVLTSSLVELTDEHLEEIKSITNRNLQLV